MESSSIFEQLLEKNYNEGWMSEKLRSIVHSFFTGYHSALKSHGIPPDTCLPWFKKFLELLKMQHETPFIFQPFHERIRFPYDYYAWGNDFLRALVDEKKSTLRGEENIKEIVSHLKKGHNVILLANHQIEPDPQAISIMLDDRYPKLAEEMIFVAGERVITDPLAVPFSMGRNLLCIYSKRYIDVPPEKKTEKQHHNKKTMELMSYLLKQGGKCIYVAPSGGRDRKNAKGVIEVGKFDPQSIEMFYLMAQKSGTPTFFYPMALSTYDLFPPPETIQVELGEKRITKRGPIHLSVGSCIDMKQFPGYDLPDKRARRQARADFIWGQVCKDYKTLGKP
jgi:glycerol-3-phosphate O-acyltransferase